MNDGFKINARQSQIGVIGDHAQIGEIHFHTPKARIPLQRPSRVEYFTGREEELSKILADVQLGHVVTLCGPGGVGKTSLASEVAWTLAPGDEPPERFPDGMIFYSFYGRPNVELAFEHIIRSLDDTARDISAKNAYRLLSGKRILLILDGTEDADNLQSLLEMRDNCGVLITSRNRQDAVAELQNITPLPSQEAVQLLQAWGGARAADQTACQQICELVGGLPLAVRLIGRYLAETEEDAHEYLTWLVETPLQALDIGARKLESVPLLLERSLTQISRKARQALGAACLVALVPFDRGIVEKALELSADQTRRLLGELVNYGLLIRIEQNYKISHALIHTYTRLQNLAPRKAIRRLATYYTSLAEEHNEEVRKSHVNRGNAELASHIMAILTGCIEWEDWEATQSLARVACDFLDTVHQSEHIEAAKAGLLAVRALANRQDEEFFLASLGTAYWHKGIFGWETEERFRYYEQALSIARELGCLQDECDMLHDIGRDYWKIGQQERSIEYLEQALVISRKIDESEKTDITSRKIHHTFVLPILIANKTVELLDELGRNHIALSQMDQAIEYYVQALANARKRNDPRAEGIVLSGLGNAYATLGDRHKALEYYEQALVLIRVSGDRHMEGNALGNLANIYADLGDTLKAIEFYEQQLVIARQIDDPAEGYALGNLGVAHGNLGDLQKAIECYEKALPILHKDGERNAERFVLGNLGVAFATLGKLDKAIEFYERQLVILREIGERRDEGLVLQNLGNIYAALKMTEKAIACYEQALDIAREHNDRPSEGALLVSLGVAHHKNSNLVQATKYYEEALAIVQETGDQRNEGATLINLGQIANQQGNAPRARNMWTRALHIYDVVDPHRAETIRGWLAGLEKQPSKGENGWINIIQAIIAISVFITVISQFCNR